MSSVYKINAKYLRITCYGRVLGFWGGGIKGKEKITKFNTNKNTERAKIFNKTLEHQQLHFMYTT